MWRSYIWTFENSAVYFFFFNFFFTPTGTSTRNVLCSLYQLIRYQDVSNLKPGPDSISNNPCFLSPEKKNVDILKIKK